MAQVTPDEKQWVDRQLAYALDAWSRLPEVEATIDTWPEYEAIDFLTEWSLEDDRLHRLRESFERGHLTADQEVQFRELAEVAARNEPIIDRLINGSPSDGAPGDGDRRNGPA